MGIKLTNLQGTIEALGIDPDDMVPGGVNCCLDNCLEPRASSTRSPPRQLLAMATAGWPSWDFGH